LALAPAAAGLPDELPVYPTHGAGSFCTAPGNAERTATIGAARAHNPLLTAPDEEAFAERLLGELAGGMAAWRAAGLPEGRVQQVAPGEVALTACLTGLIAARAGLRPEPFYLGVAYAGLGLGLSALVVVRPAGTPNLRPGSSPTPGIRLASQRRPMIASYLPAVWSAGR
jgi:hydroxyacylglutathione hydrolase